MTHKMYPFSKNKSSFRIADILHQQQQQQQQQTTDSQLLAHHLMMKGGGSSDVARSSESNKNSENHHHHKSQSNEIKNVNDLSSSKSPSPIGEQQHSPEHHALKASGGGGGTTTNDMPMKPTPMYSNFPLPFPLGIHPAFHPAAYLNYADAIHKVSSARNMWPYFHPYSGYLLPPCGSKRKGGQVRFTPQQTQNLERRFANHKYLSPEDRRKLALELSLSDRQVKTWFQNRRAKWRRANNATGTSNGHSNQHTIADNLSSASSDDDEDLSQKPLQMYLHHQQYYKQMKEFQKQQQQHQKDDGSDNEDNVEVN